MERGGFERRRDAGKAADWKERAEVRSGPVFWGVRNSRKKIHESGSKAMNPAKEKINGRPEELWTSVVCLSNRRKSGLQ